MIRASALRYAENLLGGAPGGLEVSDQSLHLRRGRSASFAWAGSANARVGTRGPGPGSIATHAVELGEDQASSEDQKRIVFRDRPRARATSGSGCATSSLRLKAAPGLAFKTCPQIRVDKVEAGAEVVVERSARAIPARIGYLVDGGRPWKRCLSASSLHGTAAMIFSRCFPSASAWIRRRVAVLTRAAGHGRGSSRRL